MKRLILGLFVVFGMAVNVVSGAEIYKDEQEKIDEIMAQYEKTLKAYGVKRPTIEMCDKKNYKSYPYYSKFCPTERFLNFVEFYKSYGGKFDGYEAFKEAKRDKDRQYKYHIFGSENNMEHYIFVNHKRLIDDLEQDELRAGAIRLNRTGL